MLEYEGAGGDHPKSAALSFLSQLPALSCTTRGYMHTPLSTHPCSLHKTCKQWLHEVLCWNMIGYPRAKEKLSWKHRAITQNFEMYKASYELTA